MQKASKNLIAKYWESELLTAMVKLSGSREDVADFIIRHYEDYLNLPKPANYRQSHCDIEGCERPHSAKGLCYKHYYEANRESIIKRTSANQKIAKSQPKKPVVRISKDDFWEFVKQELQIKENSNAKPRTTLPKV